MSDAAEAVTNEVPRIGPKAAPVAKPAIHAAMAACMLEVGGVAKGRKNEAQNYKFRGIADITLACQPVLAKHGVHVVPWRVITDSISDRPTSKGNPQLHVRQTIEFRFFAVDGSYVSCVTTGEALDTGDKASNKAMSAALKYALVLALCIPEEDPEIDTEAHSPTLEAPAPKARAAAPAAAPFAPKETPAPKSTPAASAPETPVSDTPAEHPAVAQVKAAFPGAWSPTDAASAEQIRLLAIAMGNAGLKEKADRLGWISIQIGRAVGSSKELSSQEAHALIKKADALAAESA